MRTIGAAEVRSASFELTRMMRLLSSAHPIALGIKNKELAMQQREIENLKEIIALLKKDAN
jgi:hypothetical protein